MTRIIGQARRLRLMVPLLVVSALATGMLVRPAAALAQVSPSDEASVLLRTAMDFEDQGRQEIAEALLVHIIEHYPGTVAARQALERLSRPPSSRTDRVSRLELPVFGTLYGLWLGVAVPVALGSTDSEAYGAGLLTGVPIGLFSSLYAQRSQRYTEGQARAITWGGSWGTWQGLGWAKVLDFGQQELCSHFGCYPTDDDTEEVFTAMIIGGLAGIVTGAILARNPVRSGVSSAAQGGSTWGSVYGALVAELFDEDDWGDNEAVLAASLIAGNVGLLAAERLASAYDVSRPRVRLINLGALGGGLVGLGVDLLTDPGDNAAIAIPLVSSVTGLVIATLASGGRDRVEDRTPDSAEGTALLSYSGGVWQRGSLLPVPTLLPFDRRDGRPGWAPGVRVEWLRMRF